MTHPAAHSSALHHLIAGELRLLELLATEASLPTLLEAFVHSFESSFPEAVCAAMLLNVEGTHLQLAAAPSLPMAFRQAVDGLAVGARMGSCGTAAFTRQTTLVSDISVDPLWQDHPTLALAHGLRACWSTPILSAKGRLLGTFANYFAQQRTPEPHKLAALKRGAHLLGLVVDHHQLSNELVSQQAALRESEARYLTLVEWSPEAVGVHRNGTILYVNAAMLKLLRASSDSDLLGRNIIEFLHPDDLEIGMERARVVAELGVNLPMREEKLRRMDGSYAEVGIQSAAIRYDGAPAVYVVAHDLSKMRQDEETSHHLAFYDPLTGLASRRLLMDRLQQALVMSGRKQQYGALLLLDLDHFKQVNDLVGHNVGDALLSQVAHRLLACVRKSDSVARVGGDEFMVLLETFADTATEAAHHAEAIGNKVLASLREPYKLFDLNYTSTPSIGVVVFMEGQHSRDEVVKNADSAMYQAKAEGRNSLRFFDPAMQARALARAEFVQDMRHGVERQEFSLHYQIQVNAQGATTGAEALIRWHSAKRGMVSPLEFIGLAEENGLILPLGQFVLESACAQLMQWASQPETASWTVAVNVSARQFSQDNFVDNVALALKKTGANPAQLKLELTESMLVGNVDDVILKMSAIKAIGVSFSLDDFGTGYSSLSYLKLLPLAQLKIDQSFVRDLLTDPNDAVIARTIVALGHSLGMMVIAEGVETAEQLDLLTHMGCDAFQGYYLGRPQPPERLSAWTRPTPGRA